MSQQKTQQERAREVEDYLISSLPGAKRRDWEKAPYDFTFEPQNQKIEVKYSGLREILQRRVYCPVSMDRYRQGGLRLPFACG
jgi:hypothetical protein